MPDSSVALSPADAKLIASYVIAAMSSVAPAMMSAAETAAYCGFSVRKLWGDVSADKFPRPVDLNGCTRWRRSAIDAFLENLKTEGK